MLELVSTCHCWPMPGHTKQLGRGYGKYHEIPQLAVDELAMSALTSSWALHIYQQRLHVARCLCDCALNVFHHQQLTLFRRHVVQC